MASHRHAHRFKRSKHHTPTATQRAVTRSVAAATADAPIAELRKGLDAFERGDYFQAIQSWKRAQHAEAQPGATAALAEAFFRRALGAANEARRIQELSEAVQLAPNRALYHFHLGLAYARNGQLRRAIAALEAARRLEPDNTRFHRHYALAILTDPVVAPDGVRSLEQVSGFDEAAARLQVVALLRQGKPTSAAAIWSTLRNPSDLACLSLGIAKLAAGLPSEALDHLPELAHNAAINAEARQAAAIATVVAQLQQGDSAAAFDALRQQSVPADPRLRAAFAAAAERVVQELVLDERIEDAVLACEHALAAQSGLTASVGKLLAHLHEVLGTRAAQRGEFAAAAHHWEVAAALESDNPRILRNLALAEEKLERWKSACQHWEAVAHQWKKELRTRVEDRNNAELRLRLALAYSHLASCFQAAGDGHAAVRSLESAFNFDGSQVDLHVRAAELYLEAESYARAIEHLRRALTAHPDDTRVLATLGAAYNLKGDDRKAEAYLNQALALEPENAAAKAGLAGVHHERGHRLLQGGHAEGAVDEFWKAMDLDHSTDEHVYCLGKAYVALGWLQGARKAFDASLAVNPDPVGTRVRIGDAYLGGGFGQEADRVFRQALRISRAPSVRVAIGHVHMRHGRLDAANQQFQEVRKSRDPHANAAIGRLFIGAEQEEEAIPYLERAVALDALDANTFLDLAYALAFGQDDYSRAFAELANAERAANLSGQYDLLPEIESARATVGKLLSLSELGRGAPRRK